MLRGVVSLVLALQVLLAGVPVRITLGGTGSSAAAAAEGCCAPVQARSCCTSTAHKCCCGAESSEHAGGRRSAGGPALSACPCDGPSVVVIQPSAVFVGASVEAPETVLVTTAGPAFPPPSASRPLPPEPPPPRLPSA